MLRKKLIPVMLLMIIVSPLYLLKKLNRYKPHYKRYNGYEIKTALFIMVKFHKPIRCASLINML